MGNALQSYAHKKPALNATPLVLVRLPPFDGFNRLVLGQAPSGLFRCFYLRGRKYHTKSPDYSV